jgi:hypothetical protein
MKEIPKPTIITNYYKAGDEFIQVDEHSSFYGNFYEEDENGNEIQGCHLKKGFNTYNNKFYVKLSGNDDDSWTKYFDTEEDAQEEVYRLRRSQPINKEFDVKQNGYEFTN